jgi:lysophospholipase L1-like esterase
MVGKMFKEISLSTLLATVLASSILFAPQAIACPAVGKLPDFNCDGEARIVVLGDSLAYGFGDTVNGNKGGYVLRAQKAFPNATFSNFGVQGLQSLDLILDIKRAFDGRGDSDLANALVKADAVILDLGRNDRWLFGLPSATLRNLKRAASLIRKNVTKVTDTSPLVIQAVLMYPNRGSQGPWVKELDALILKSSSTAAPADLRFDLVSKRLLSEDQIHPTSKGYQAMTAVFVKYLRNNYPKYVARLRPDADQDGLYDVFESSKFGTDPANPDSNGDGILDGK